MSENKEGGLNGFWAAPSARPSRGAQAATRFDTLLMRRRLSSRCAGVVFIVSAAFILYGLSHGSSYLMAIAGILLAVSTLWLWETW